MESIGATRNDSFLASDVAETVNDKNAGSQRPVSNLTLGDLLNGDTKPPSNAAFVRTILKSIKRGVVSKTRQISQKKSFKPHRRVRRYFVPHSSNYQPESEPELVMGNSFKDEDEDKDEGDSSHALDQPRKMSLMELLEEANRQAGISGPTYKLDKGEEFRKEFDEDDGKGGYSCCVCKEKHKGSPFVHCGHTLCGLCSRELMVQKENYPHCNDFILEILDTF